MQKVLCVFGTRPDAIKMAPVVLELKRRPAVFDVKVAVTGQHREMLDQVLSVFGIVPDFDLNIMAHGASLAQITTRALDGLAPVLAQERPDWVLAQGTRPPRLWRLWPLFINRPSSAMWRPACGPGRSSTRFRKK